MFRGSLFLFVIAAALLVRFYLFFTAPRPYMDGDLIRISSVIRSEPVRYETSQYVKIGGLKTYLPLYPQISYGDKITVTGKVSGDKLVGVSLERIEPTKGFVYKFRQKLLNIYETSLPSPHFALVAGVTIGSKVGIPSGFWDELKNSGTAHVVVASGMNVSLVAGFLMSSLAIFIKRKKAIIIALAGVWFYAILCGFDAPIVRSAIMGSVAFTAQEFGRLTTSLRALVLSALIMLFISPGYIQDVGFLLSFFATLGLILFEGGLRKKIGFIPQFVREDLSTTLAAQIGVLPVMLWTFGKFNPLSPIANILVLWTIVPMTVLGMVGGLIGLVVPILGKYILLLTYPLTWWFISVVGLFG